MTRAQTLKKMYIVAQKRISRYGKRKIRNMRSRYVSAKQIFA